MDWKEYCESYDEYLQQLRLSTQQNGFKEVRKVFCKVNNIPVDKNYCDNLCLRVGCDKK